MTERQILLFFDQAQRRENRKRAHRISDVNAGTKGDSPTDKSVTRFIEKLLKED